MAPLWDWVTVYTVSGRVFHYALAPGCTSRGPCSRWAWRPLQNVSQELSHYFFSFTDTFVLCCFFVGAYWCLDVLRPCQGEKREFTFCGTLLSPPPILNGSWRLSNKDNKQLFQVTCNQTNYFCTVKNFFSIREGGYLWCTQFKYQEKNLAKICYFTPKCHQMSSQWKLRKCDFWT